MRIPMGLAVPAVFSLLSSGCAEHLSLTSRNLVESGGYTFWPPPRPTSLEVLLPPDATGDRTFSEARLRVATVLDDAGYRDLRWAPIGLECAHGFFTTTRLEAIDEAGASRSGSERWARAYDKPLSLFWLGEMQRPELLQTGRYRAFLVALSNLPIGDTNVAPRWNDETVMAGPELPVRFPRSKRVTRDYRMGVYVYEYESDAEGTAARLARDESRPASMQVQAAGLSALGR